MWYEILPTYITITTLLSIPNLFVYFTNKLILSEPFRRRLTDEEEFFHYLRDGQLSPRTWAYDFAGLENIPDPEEPPQQQEPTSSC